MPCTLRPAQPEDAARVADILLASRHAFLPYAPLAHTDDEVRDWVRTVLVPGGVTLACRGAETVGMLATACDGGIGWIEQLYIDPPHVGRGVGMQLLAHALQTLPRPVRLYTFQANDGARRFYERHGFRAIAFTDGSGNEEHCPDVLYELA